MSSRLRLTLFWVLAVMPCATTYAGRYEVTLRLLPGEDARAIGRQIATVTRGEIEPGSDGEGARFILKAGDAAIGVIRNYPRVASVEELSVQRPGILQPDSGSTWTTGTYAYDGSGNVKTMARADYTEQYVYDALGRIVSGTAGPNHSEQYTYDPFGNLLTIKRDGQTLTVGAMAQTNRITDASATYWGTYDPAGRLETNSGGDAFKYDSVQAVIESTVEGVHQVHLYNTSDERVATGVTQTTSTGTTVTSWEITVRDLSGRVLRRVTKTSGGAVTWREDYVYRGTQLLAADVSDPERRRFFHPDHLGTPRLITGNGGAQVSTHTYYPFGREVAPPNNAERAKFTGHERDAAALDYMHARYYNPMLGRFLSPDPTWSSADLGKPQSWNRYSYVMNNPVSMTDPDGKCPICIYVAAGIIGGLFLSAAPANAPTSAHAPIYVNADPIGIAGSLRGIGIAGAGNALTSVFSQAANEDAELNSAARERADQAQADGKTGGAASAYRTNDGKIHTSVSGHGKPPGPQTKEALDAVPANQRSAFHGKCAECGAITNAENAGSPVGGGRMSTVNIRSPGNALHGTPKPPCATCEAVMTILKIFF